MDVAALSMIMSQGAVQQQVGVEVAAKAMDVAKDQGTQMVKMMEQSVAQNVGRAIDIKL